MGGSPLAPAAPPGFQRDLPHGLLLKLDSKQRCNRPLSTATTCLDRIIVASTSRLELLLRAAPIRAVDHAHRAALSLRYSRRIEWQPQHNHLLRAWNLTYRDSVQATIQQPGTTCCAESRLKQYATWCNEAVSCCIQQLIFAHGIDPRILTSITYDNHHGVRTGRRRPRPFYLHS